MSNTPLYTHYKNLLEKHGDPSDLWPQWCAEEKNEQLMQLVAIGAILVQRTSWRNAERALENLKTEDYLSIDILASLQNPSAITEIVRPAGFYTTKPRRLVEFSKFATERYRSMSGMADEEVDSLRPEMLDVYGIGPETADTIILFGLNKPSFIIDAYTQRWLAGNADISEDTCELPYMELKQRFEEELPHDVQIYQNFHILIIVDQKGRDRCRMGVV